MAGEHPFYGALFATPLTTMRLIEPLRHRLGGGGDRVVPGWMHRRWEAALPHAHVDTLSGFPHVPRLRDPQRVARLIRDAMGSPAE